MTEELFDRVYELRADTVRIGTTVSGSTAHNVRFSVERTLRRRPNRSEISIWNLDPDQRSMLHNRSRSTPIQVELLAGYAEGGPGLIFRGDLFDARTTEAGADLVTRIKSRDGHGAHRARTSRTSRPGTSVSTVVQGLVADLGIGDGNLADVLGELRIGDSPIFSAGATFLGSASDALDRVFASTGHEWSVQANTLQVLPRGRGLSRTAIELRTDTGLTKRPTRTDRGKVEVETRLIAALVPGALVRLDAFGERGTFRAERVLTRGEFRSTAEWGHQCVLGEVPS